MKACMMLALATFLAVVMGVAVLPAQEKKDDDDLSTPGPEHKLLEALAGTYAAKVKAWVEPGKDPEISDGAMKRKMLYGGRYLLEEFEGKLGPEPLSGMGFV